jgi:uncharacterized damage-inducible protein DinB
MKANIVSAEGHYKEEETMSKPDVNPIASSAQSLYEIVKGDTLAAAEAMPESAYDFKPRPEMRSFGQQLAHLADANYLFGSSYFGEANPFPGVTPTQAGILEETKNAKREIVEALKSSFDYCDRAFNQAADTELAEEAKFTVANRDTVNKAFLLNLTFFHAVHHYGAITTYLRLKGIVPPSTERLRRQSEESRQR